MPLLQAKPDPIEIDYKSSAVVIVDMQNAFVSKGGMFDLAGKDISGVAPVVEANKRLVAAARTASMKVIYLQMTYEADLSNAGSPTSPNYHKEIALDMMRTRPELAGKLLIRDSWDWQIIDELTPEPGDIVVEKNRYSGFWGTPLDNILRSNNIRHLLFTGVATNVCVESTARDAFFNEYWPVLVTDAMNHAGPEFVRDATEWNFEHVFGWLTNTGNVMQALGPALD